MTTSYNLPDPDPNSQLVEPSHAQLHTATNHAINDITSRVVAVETAIAATTAPDGAIEQARLVANTWTVPGNLGEEHKNIILSPVLWNLGTRDATFDSAKASVMYPPVGGEIQIDIVRSAALVSNEYGTGQAQTSILVQKLVIPDGANFSTTTYGPDKFVGVHTRDTWVSAVITSIGGTGAQQGTGYDLTIQLNRLL